MRLAEEIRHFVSEHHIKPAKERGETKLVVVDERFGGGWMVGSFNANGYILI